MKKRLAQFLGLTVLTLMLLQCNNDTDRLDTTLKFHPNDPFQETMVPSQTFDIDAKDDNVVEGKHGTILVIPKGCFKNAKGETVTDNVKIELAEALSLDQMLLSNLTTTSKGNLLETDGMIYLNATADGEQLTIDKDNPVYMEIPTEKRKPGMMAYKGVRDENGNMDWIEPKELDKFLMPVDINLLNFYPEGFEAEVMVGLPFKNHKTATKDLIDSLYYSLSVSDGSELLEGLVGTNYNEPYYNQNKEVVAGKYTDKSYELSDLADTTAVEAACGIDPAIIKVIKSDKFQNTLISTREFETRLQTIFKACRNDIIEIYIKNLDKNLWELDSMAASILGEHTQYGDFYDFYKQGLTNVKNADKYSELLQGYYEKQLTELKSELKTANEKVLKELQEKNEVAQQVANEYKEVLWKREKYRMETYGFEWSETGWLNIDIGIIPKDWAPQRIEILVLDGKNFDRVHTYTVGTAIRTIYRLNSTDNESFFVGNDPNNELLMSKIGKTLIISIAYKDETPFLATKEFETGSEPKLTLALEESTTEKIAEVIKTYNNYKQENRIDKDLEYMTQFAQEKKRQEKLKSESEFIGRLWRKVYPCCKTETDYVDEEVALN